MRKLIFKLHLYSALVAGAVLLVIGISGCLLVFELSVDRWVDKSIAFVEPRGTPIPLGQIAQTVTSTFPGKQILEFDLGGPDTSVIVRLNGPVRVFVNGYSGEILGTRDGEPASYWLRHIHRELAAGAVGTNIVRLATMIMILLAFSGLYLWWPIKRVTVKWSSTWRRINFDLHHAVGFCASLFLCVIAVTGLIKGFNDDLLPFFDRITGDPAPKREQPSASDGSGSKATLDEAIATARAQLPGAMIARITPPKVKDGSIVITMKYPDDSTVPGRSWVVVDQYNGRVLARQDARTAAAAAKIPILNRAIHVGGIYGVSTRIVAFLTSLAMLVQLATGVLMWWRWSLVKLSEPR